MLLHDEHTRRKTTFPAGQSGIPNSLKFHKKHYLTVAGYMLFRVRQSGGQGCTRGITVMQTRAG
jgi:hypothetical protein